MSRDIDKESYTSSSPTERRIAPVLRLFEGKHRAYQRAAVDEAVDLGPAIRPALIAILDKVVAEPEAFRRLQKLAMDKRKSLREVAEALLLAAQAEDAGDDG